MAPVAISWSYDEEPAVKESSLSPTAKNAATVENGSVKQKKSKGEKETVKKRKRKSQDAADADIPKKKLKTPEKSDTGEKKSSKKKTAQTPTAESNGTPESPAVKTDDRKKASRKKKKLNDSVSSVTVPDSPAIKDGPETIKINTETMDVKETGDLTKFNISEKTIEKLKARNITYLFPVQSSTYNFIRAGYDVIALARTGTGKTLSFALPLVEKLQEESVTSRGRAPRALMMAPTRELARQITEDIESISDRLKVLTVYGGIGYREQGGALRAGVDVVVGTPGRILDFAEQGTLRLCDVRHVVLDEVDRMLDMGFAKTVESILNFAYKEGDSWSNPQTLLFSATVPDWVHKTAKKYMKNNVKNVDLVGNHNVKTAITVQHLALKCGYWDRASALGDVLQVYSGVHGRAMVFCQTKKEADELTVSAHIRQEAHVMHGDVPQDKREMVLKSFREGRVKVLVTTDVAARGLDIPEVDLVVQLCPPKDVDSYIHRSGRTGRAGRQGTCVCFFKPEEEYQLGTVERIAGIKFRRVGAPTPEDIIRSSAEDAARSLEEVKPAVLEQFLESARDVVRMRGAEQAVAAALAVISGSSEVEARSLLNARPGFITYVFRSSFPLRFVSFVWNVLERQLPAEVKDSVKGMRFIEDKTGVVFDIPTEHEDAVNQHWQDNDKETLAKATELPKLLEYENNGNGFRGGDNSRGFRGRGGRGQGRGWGGRGRGRGGGRW